MTVCYSVCVHLCLRGSLPKRKRKAKTEKDDTGGCYEGGRLLFTTFYIFCACVVVNKDIAMP